MVEIVRTTFETLPDGSRIRCGFVRGGIDPVHVQELPTADTSNSFEWGTWSDADLGRLARHLGEMSRDPERTSTQRAEAYGELQLVLFELEARVGN